MQNSKNQGQLRKNILLNNSKENLKKKGKICVKSLPFYSVLGDNYYITKFSVLIFFLSKYKDNQLAQASLS